MKKKIVKKNILVLGGKGGLLRTGKRIELKKGGQEGVVNRSKKDWFRWKSPDRITRKG